MLNTKLNLIYIIMLSLPILTATADNPVDLAIVDSSPANNQTTESFKVFQLNKPIKLDGQLNEKIWKTIPFFSFNGPESNHTERTEFAIAQNQWGLYIAFRCYEPALSTIRTTCEIRDGLFEYFRKDDWIELLLDPGNTGHDYYWLIVNADGMQTDLCCQADPDRSWNGEWQAVTGREDSAWTVEMFLPFPMFNRSRISDTWRFNAARLHVGSQIKNGEPSHVRTIWSGKHRKPETWPTLTEINLNTNLFNFNITPLVITPGIKQNSGIITATVQNNTDTALNLSPTFRAARPGSAKGLAPHGWGPSEDLNITPCSLTSGNKIKISTPISINQDEIIIAQLLLRDKAGNLRYMTRDIGIKPENIIDGPGPELSLYTTESTAKLFFKLRLFGEKMQLKIKLSINNKDLITHNIPALDSEVEDTFNIKKLSPGLYKISAELLDNNTIIATREYQLYKIASSYTNAVKINRVSRCLLINEKPFVAVGNSPGISHGIKHASTMMNEMAKNGFNTMHLWGGYLKRDKNRKRLPELDLKTLNAVFNAADTNNLKVIISLGTITQNNPASPFIAFKLTDKQRIDLILEIVNILKTRKSLLSYEIADEPEWFVAPDWLEKVYKAIKQADPSHLVTINNCRGARSTLTYARASDIASLDYYPAGKWPVSTVGPLTSEIVNLAGRRPVSMWVQGYKIFNPREPLPEEVIMMSYSMFARGASSLFYFIGRPKPILWDAQSQCAREITSLGNAAAAAQQIQLITSPGSNIYASLRLSDSEGWIIAVNESEEKTTADIILPNETAPTNASVLFESRKIKVENNRITDTFSPFARHIYKWNR